jgi:hypothetical protein
MISITNEISRDEMEAGCVSDDALLLTLGHQNEFDNQY